LHDFKLFICRGNPRGCPESATLAVVLNRDTLQLKNVFPQTGGGERRPYIIKNTKLPSKISF